MLIAIPAEAAFAEAKMDERFGRCPFFCLFDTYTKTLHFTRNVAADAQEGVGPRAAEFLAGQGVKQVYSLEVGPKATAILEKLGIEVRIAGQRDSIENILPLFTQEN